jgi:hypothetical protein
MEVVEKRVKREDIVKEKRVKRGNPVKRKKDVENPKDAEKNK